MKALWLAGYPVGAADATGAAELLDTRHIIGDAVTAVMELCAIAVVLTFTYRWGHRLPALLLLAPMAFGTPLGLLAQTVAGGSPAPADGGTHGWIYLVADGGFIIQAIGLFGAFLGHAHDRWPRLFSVRTAQLRAVSRGQRRLATTAAVIAAAYVATLIAWAISGPSWGGPAGFQTITQKTFLTFLLTGGLLVLAGAVTVPALLARRRNQRLLALAWIGPAATALSGPTHIALSNHGHVSLPLITAGTLATLSGLILAGSAVRVLTPAEASDSN